MVLRATEVELGRAVAEAVAGVVVAAVEDVAGVAGRGPEAPGQTVVLQRDRHRRRKRHDPGKRRGRERRLPRAAVDPQADEQRGDEQEAVRPLQDAEADQDADQDEAPPRRLRVDPQEDPQESQLQQQAQRVRQQRDVVEHEAAVHRGGETHRQRPVRADEPLGDHVQQQAGQAPQQDLDNEDRQQRIAEAQLPEGHEVTVDRAVGEGSLRDQSRLRELPAEHEVLAEVEAVGEGRRERD